MMYANRKCVVENVESLSSEDGLQVSRKTLFNRMKQGKPKTRILRRKSLW